MNGMTPRQPQPYTLLPSASSLLLALVSTRARQGQVRRVRHKLRLSSCFTCFTRQEAKNEVPVGTSLSVLVGCVSNAFGESCVPGDGMRRSTALHYYYTTVLLYYCTTRKWVLDRRDGHHGGGGGACRGHRPHQ
eukprot:1194760-Prorocentrum_minimum.AAC.1